MISAFLNPSYRKQRLRRRTAANSARATLSHEPNPPKRPVAEPRASHDVLGWKKPPCPTVCATPRIITDDEIVTVGNRYGIPFRSQNALTRNGTVANFSRFVFE